MQDRSRPRRPHGPGAYALVVGASLVLGGLAGAASAFFNDQPGPVGTAMTAALVTAAMAVGFTACVWWWRGIDEAAREAHKWAWWWGGSGGMAVGAGVRRGDPLTLAVRQRRRAVQRGRHLHAHPGRFADHAAEKPDVEFTGFGGAGADFDFNAGGPQALEALTTD